MDWTCGSPQMSIIPGACGDKASTEGDQAIRVREHVSQRQDTRRISPTGRRQYKSVPERQDTVPSHVLGGNQLAKKETTKICKGGVWHVGPETFRTTGGAINIGKVENMDQILKKRKEKFNLQMKQLNNVIDIRKDIDKFTKANCLQQLNNNENDKRQSYKVHKSSRDDDATPLKILEHIKQEEILGARGCTPSTQNCTAKVNISNPSSKCSRVNKVSKHKIKIPELKETVPTITGRNAIHSPILADKDNKPSKVQALSTKVHAHQYKDKADLVLDNLSLTKACSQTSSQKEKQRVEQQKKHEKLTGGESIHSLEIVGNSPSADSSPVIYESPIQESCSATQKYSNTNGSEILTFSAESLKLGKILKGNIIHETVRKQNLTSPTTSCKQDLYLSGLANLAQHQSTDFGDLALKYEASQDFQVKPARELSAHIVITKNVTEETAKKSLQAVHVNEDLLANFSLASLKDFDVLSESTNIAKMIKQPSELNKCSNIEKNLKIKVSKPDEKALETCCSSDSGFESLIEECSNADNTTTGGFLDKSPRFTMGSSSTSYSESSATSCSSYESFDVYSRSPSPEVETSKSNTLNLWLMFDEKKNIETGTSIEVDSPYNKTQLPLFSQVENEMVTYFHAWVSLISDKDSSIVKDLQAKYEAVLPMCVIKPPNPLKIKRVEGQRDKKGKLHGEAEIYYENGDYFWGDLVHGSREGMASYIVKKTDDNFIGRYKNNQLDGFVVETISFCDRDCVEREVFYRHGVQHGFYREFDRTKQFWSIGRFENGEKTGIHWKWNPGHGFNVGEMNQNNEPIGDSFYFYPDFYTVIRGLYINGKLKKGKQVRIAGYGEQYGIPFPKVEAMPSDTFFYSPSKTTVIAKRPKLRDPYESRYVFVDQSEIPFAGEGLFAKEDIKVGQLCASFNGVRQRQLWGSKNEVEVWSDYRITVNRDIDLDIWKEHESLENYRATLGHKACHSFVHNAGFHRLDHPQYGQIMSVVAISDISAGEEILVCYNYSIPKAPLWYQELWFAHCRNHLNWTEDEILKWTEKMAKKSGVSIVPLPPPKDSNRFVPCGECNEHVGLHSCSVMCELCGHWHHLECVQGLDLKSLEEERRESFEWLCQSCRWNSGKKG